MSDSVGGNPFYVSSTVNKELLAIFAKNFEKSNGKNAEFVVGGNIGGRHAGFHRAVSRIEINVVTNVSIPADLPDMSIKISFVSFLCADMAALSGLEGTIHIIKEHDLCFAVNGRSSSYRVINRRERRRAADYEVEGCSSGRQVDVVVRGVF